MATRVDLNHFLLAQLNWPTQKTPHRERIAYILSQLQAVLWPILCLNLSLFGYCVNKGWSSKRLNDNVQVANTENPLFGGKMWGLMRQLMANIVLKFPACC